MIIEIKDKTLTYSISEVLEEKNIYDPDDVKCLIKNIDKIENILVDGVNDINILKLNNIEWELLHKLLQFKWKLDDLKKKHVNYI